MDALAGVLSAGRLVAAGPAGGQASQAVTKTAARNQIAVARS